MEKERRQTQSPFGFSSDTNTGHRSITVAAMYGEKIEKPGDQVRIRPEPGLKLWKQATVVDHHSSPRSYIVDTEDKKLRSNRVALRSDQGRSAVEQEDNSDNLTREDNDHQVPPGNPNPERDVNTPQAYHSPLVTGASMVKDKQATSIQASVTENTGYQEHYITRSGRISRKPAKLNI